MRLRRRFVEGAPAALAAAVLLACASCGGRAPARPDEARLAMSHEPSSLSLVGNTDANSAQLASVISDGLVAYDARGRYVPMVARSWESSPDGRTYTFHLRDGVLWHDGTEVTARDVAYTAELVREPATQARSWASAFADVAAIDTPDDRTVIVRYAHPYADALDAWRVPLVPEHVAAKDPDFLKGSFARSPVGCGPFRFVSHVPDQSIVLEAFDRYWQGRPPIDRLVIRILANERTGYEALLLGDIDVMAVTPDLWRESLASGRAARLARFVYYRLSSWKVDWNQDGSNPFFGDPRVRKALVYALDRKRFAATVVGGLARPAAGSYPPESPWSNAEVRPLPFDPAESGRLLDAAGWRLPPGGTVREKGGRTFRFTMLVPAGSQEMADRIAAWMQSSLADVGVAMAIEKVEWKAFQDRRRKHAFEAAMAGLSVDLTPDQYDLYHSAAREAGFNYGGFADAEVDRLLDQGRTTLDPGARRAIYDRLQVRLAELEPISVLFQFAQPVLHDSRLEGIVASPSGLLDFDPGPRAWHWAGARAGR